MYSQSIPNIGRLLDLADVPTDIDITVRDSVGRMQESLIEYYKRNPDFAVVSYDFAVDDVVVESVDSLLGRPFKSTPRLQSTTLTSDSFSNYSKTLLDEFVGEDEDIWNGSVAYLVHDDGDVKIGETDYYSVRTVSDLLQLEALYASYVNNGPKNVKMQDFPVRNELCRTTADFNQPKRPMGASSGGVILANTEHGWRLLLGRRSEELATNPGMISIIPDGIIEYDDLWGGGFTAAARREFAEKLFGGDTEATQSFMRQYVETSFVTGGWNLRDSGMAFGSLFIIQSPDGYRRFLEQQDVSYEISGIFEIDVFDVRAVIEHLHPSRTSGAEIGLVCEALDAFDKNPAYPSLPYSVQERLK